jgi:hypothetical protein
LEYRTVFRTAAIVLVLVIGLAGCSPGESTEAQAEPASVGLHRGATTPEQAVELFIEAQRAGDLAAAKAIIYPEDSPFKLDRPVVIQTFQILAKRVLTAADSADSAEEPERKEGDVVIEVYEEYDRGRTSQVTYFLREMNGEWRIYSLSFTL